MVLRALRRFAALALVATLTVPAGSALARPQGVAAKTNKGGSCQLEAALARAGGEIEYGGRVHSCSARFGIREVRGRALLYEGINTALVVGDTLRQRGEVPFTISGSYSGDAEEQYESRFDVTVVINGGKSLTKPKHPEKWTDPGPGCRVISTRRSGDTLGCILAVVAPPG